MKGYWLEGLAAVAQVLLYYLLPAFAGPTDGIAMVLLILLGTLVLSGALGCLRIGTMATASTPVDLRVLRAAASQIRCLPSWNRA